MKEEIRQIQLGSGSTVCSEASTAVGKGASCTFVRPPPGIAARLNDFFIPRKMEFKRWVTDYKRCSLEGLTNSEVSNFISDMQKLVPNVFHKHIDWDQTKTEQGTWPTKKFVNMWFKNETNLATMIGLLEIVKNELKRYPTTNGTLHTA